MSREDILKVMDEAFREDRERFFKVADSIHLQPKYAEHLTELEEIKQVWRDAPQQEGYPNITHPMPLPDWFPKVKFASCWEKDLYIEEVLAMEKRREEESGFNGSGNN
ncbi:MAG: hypothetical protein IJ371_05070 [Clostridia bacterium]|nr:hypothetical protein [Clostridia bacterium]